MPTKIGKWAKRALGWLRTAAAWFKLVPPGLIDPKQYAKLVKAVTEMLKILTEAESTVGAHTVFWPTIKNAPKDAIIIVRYPSGAERELHPDTVPYLKLFKKGFDSLKKRLK